MTLENFFKRAYRSAEFRFDRATVASRNRRLDSIFAETTEFQIQRMNDSIDRGIAWFSPQADVTMSVLLCAQQTLERTKDDRFSFLYEKLEHYRQTIKDPALLMVDPTYDPEFEAYRDLPDVMDIRPYYPVELMMIDTIWAGKRPQPDIIERLLSIDDNGFYGTTHIVVGGKLLLRNGGAPADKVRDMMSSTVETIVKANQITARAEDIFAERCMVLQWMDRHDLIEPAWIMRLANYQLDDGGWKARNMPPLGGSNQHTTIVALAALAEFVSQFRR